MCASPAPVKQSQLEGPTKEIAYDHIPIFCLLPECFSQERNGWAPGCNLPGCSLFCRGAHKRSRYATLCPPHRQFGCKHLCEKVSSAKQSTSQRRRAELRVWQRPDR